jgi:hypothetical protein
VGTGFPPVSAPVTRLDIADVFRHAQIPLWAVRALTRGETLTIARRSKIAVNFNEGIARSGRSLRAPDQALESKDERIHLWRT